MHAKLKRLSSPAKREGLGQRFLPVWIGVGWWICLVSLFAVQAMVVNSEAPVSAVERACSLWLLWLGFLPAIVWLSLRFPFERPNIPFQAGVHLAGCIAILAVSQAAYRTIMTLPFPPDRHLSEAASGMPKPPGSPGMRTAPDIVIYLATMSGCVAFAHFRRSQQRERRAIELEARLAQAKLQALRNQINPHFLFNTLNAISSLVHSNAHVADEMITDLSELLRVSLERSDEQEIPLARELELLGYYLSIEQRRFGQRLQVEQHIAPGLANALVPALVLQPIVENAIRHGFEPQTLGGKIVVGVRQHGDKIRLSVRNNGVKTATPPGQPEASGHGIGLSNTQARLQQLYGDAHSFSFGADEAGGWQVTIEIPFRTAPAIPATS